MMVRLTCTGFLVPVKSAPFATALNACRERPYLECHRLDDGMNPWRGAAQGEVGLKFKAILFRLAVQADLELGVEGEERDAHRRRHDAHGYGPTRRHDRGRFHRVGGRVDHEVGSKIRDWRMRVALAAVLFASPDLLLFDEPTNYLDLEGTLWLIDYLHRYPGTVLV
jgi:hypothetical protein